MRVYPRFDSLHIASAELTAANGELRQRGFRALADALGWVNAVRFLREYDPGSGNYTEERVTLLPDMSIEELAVEIDRIQKEKVETRSEDRP